LILAFSIPQKSGVLFCYTWPIDIDLFYFNFYFYFYFYFLFLDNRDETIKQ